MKKQIITFLTLTLTLGLVPLNFSQAITQNQIDAEVQIVCPDGSGNWSSGSGTIIDSKGIILTNRHVVQGKTDIVKICFIGFIESINKAPNFGTQADPNLAEVKYYTTADDMDAAILYLNSPLNKTYPYVNIWDSNSDNLKFGDKIEVIGFPSIGGATITYTSGDFSGFGSQIDGTQNYIKTAAQVEHGNSGGGAYNSAGQFIGIPTMVVAGALNSISYVLSVNSIKSWLSGVLGGDYKQEVIEQKPVIAEPSKVDLQNDITPPYIKELSISFYAYDNNGKQIYYGNRTGKNSASAIYEFNKIKFGWEQNCPDEKDALEYCINDDSGHIEGYYYYFGDNINATPKIDGKYIESSKLVKKYKTEVQLPELFTTKENVNYYFILQAVDPSGNVSNPFMYFRYVYDTLKNSAHHLESININTQTDFIAKINYLNLKQYLLYDLKEEVDTNQKKLIITPNYNIDTNGLSYYISYGTDYCFGTPFNDSREGIQVESNRIEINDIDLHKSVNLFIKPSKNSSKYFESWASDNFAIRINYKSSLDSEIAISSNKNNRWCGGWDQNYIGDNITVELFDNNLTKRLKGNILLQTELKGEAYYINPDDSKKYSLGRPKDAFEVMRKLGLGATHEFITSHTIYPDNVLGKILLDVGDSGKAYYIYPKDKKAYYLGRPADAFKVMRELGLGITNNDLNKIPEGSL